MEKFILNPILQKDLIFLYSLNLSDLFLYPDSDNPWVVLVPRINDIREIFELNKEDQIKLIFEIDQISKILNEKFSPEKLNIGSLGNMVSQLHIHIICRYLDDKAWPNSIWGMSKGSDENKILQFKEIIINSLKI